MTDENKPITHYIQHACLTHANNTAIVFNSKTINYHELLSSSLSVARQLRDQTITTGDIVAIRINQSEKLIIIITACLLIGACYLTIEKNYPLERTNYIVNDSQPNIIICDEGNYFDKKKLNILHLKAINFNTSTSSSTITSTLPDNVNGNNPAYIVYTSGSTGTPKGIIIPHKAVNNHMLWMQQQFSLSSKDTFLLKTPLSFDPSVWEILLPLYLGAKLIVPSSNSHFNPNTIAQYVIDHRVSVLQLVPVVLYNLMSQVDCKQLNCLQYLFVGGETLPTNTKKLFFKKFRHCQLVNLYGPAEATIDSTFHVVSNSSHDLTSNIIGKPISNVSLYVAKENNQLCQVNEPGELFIGGNNLAISYVNKPEETSKRLLITPFSHGKTVYKTGDIVKWNERNQLEYCHRADNQIKLNGVRIEIDEIHSTIANIDNIHDCFFNISTNKKYQSNVLECYIIQKKNGKVDLSALISTLKSKFPQYMIPNKFYLSDVSKLSHNGKIDMKKIIKKNTRMTKKNRQTATEMKLTKIWSQILTDNINSTTVSFFELGGNSITASILANKITEVFGISVTLLTIIEHNTIEQQATWIDSLNKVSKQDSVITSLNSEASKKVFLVHPIGGTIFWFLPLAKILDGKIQLYAITDPEILKKKVNFNCIQDIAAYYATLIESTCPQTEYYLGGASFGATVAVEIARILLKKNRKIKSIFSLDGWALYPEKLKSKDYFKSSMEKQQKNWVKQFNRLDFDGEKYQNLFDIQNKRLTMLFDYHLTPLPIKIALFKAQEIMPIFKPIDEPYNHWGKHFKNVQCYHVPGNHETMFLQKNAEMIAECMIDSMKVPDSRNIITQHDTEHISAL